MAGVPGFDPSRLFTQLQNTGLTNKDQPLYQLLYLMIQQILKLTQVTDAALAPGSSSSTVINQVIQQLLLGDNFSSSGDDNQLLAIPSNVQNININQIIQQLFLADFGDNNDNLMIPGPAGVTGATGAAGSSGTIGIPGLDGIDSVEDRIFPPGDVLRTIDNFFAANQSIYKPNPGLNLKDGATTVLGHVIVLGINIYLTLNITWDGTNFNLDDTASPGFAIALSGTGLTFYAAPAAANPATLTAQFSYANPIFSLLFGQLKFPATQNPSSNANTLDDYEEGTWTPILGGATSQTGQTYSSQIGTYVKIGRLVLATAVIEFSGAAGAKGTIVGNLQIKGLPFTSDTTAGIFFMAPVNWFTVTLFTLVQSRIASNTTVAVLVGTTTLGQTVPIALTTADIADNSAFVVTYSYMASA